MRFSIIIFHTRCGLCVQLGLHIHWVHFIINHSICQLQKIWRNVNHFLLGCTSHWVCIRIKILKQLIQMKYEINQENYLQFYSEVLDTAVITWHRMRGTQMIAAVKIISIGFDLDRKKIRNFPNFIEFWGYILCPGNVVMGPWCAYNDYLYLFNQPKFVSIFIFRNASLN